MAMDDTYEDFMAVCEQFKLGDLPTESPNPVTATLSSLCRRGAQSDPLAQESADAGPADAAGIAAALRMLQAADKRAAQFLLDGLETLAPQLEAMARDVDATLRAGRCVFLEGCGATGRLSLSVEVFAREGLVAPEYRDQVKGFMAGGDAALIRSIEQFEDRSWYGGRQLRDLGFQDGDLLLAITEGGETPFVINACEAAAELSPSMPPYFLYCNPDAVLNRVAERSRVILADARVRKVPLYCGEMAITGSTRMQATTVQLLAAGLAIQHHADPARIRPAIEATCAALQTDVDYGALQRFTSAEAELYAQGEFFLYETDYFTCTVMTDTTERAPTFSLPAFENFDKPEHPASPVYLHLPGTSTPEEAWDRLLRHPPRGIAWPETVQWTGLETIYGYDFSTQVAAKRAARVGAAKSGRKVVVSKTAEGMAFTIPAVEGGEATVVSLPLPAAIRDDLLLVNVVGKAVMNAHSTCVMGALGRFRGNVMTWVRPSNNKLIDRSARYVTLLLTQSAVARGVADYTPPEYAVIVKAIYDLRPALTASEPIVLRVSRYFQEQGL